MTVVEDRPLSLLALPAELLHHVLAHLPPTDLASVSATCRLLYTHSLSDQLWQPIVNYNLPEPIHSPKPASSFRDLYVAHQPYWFLPRHRIWFSDSEPSGKLLVSRYDPRRGCIEAYSVVAERGFHTFELWQHDQSVAIHSFRPRVQLDLNQPVLKLDIGSPRTEVNAKSRPGFPHRRILLHGNRDNEDVEDYSSPIPPLAREILMDCSAPAGLYTSFMLARDLPPEATGAATSVWPPLRIPAPSRTRNASSDSFSSSGHRPAKLAEVSQNTFRLRKWVEFSGRRNSSSLMNFAGADRLSAALGLGFLNSNMGVMMGGGVSVRMGEEVATYGTLPPECYTPTPEKPWRGIWCGDYSGHGCEFLLINQPDKGTESPLPRGMDWMRDWLATGRRGSVSSQDSSTSAQEDVIMDVLEDEDGEDGDDDFAAAASSSAEAQDDASNDAYTGRLEAIKLTGDPNVPRGEYTFIAPDLSDAGLVRVASDELFQGARMVRAAGHNEYTPSQLILISHDRLAQYWEGFGHIAFYQRVDINNLLKP
ncbi:hypothetical protein H2203_000345 [Taxawa tesnikishii (nom. ined.)]|nr:hypothetical protein H2203_000345 [Dothideales sp. JES 119]